ncbi:helix-turn-helix domain-containing protein [Pseudidiomarina sp. YC-516-91]|uniref:helix-turn-helix domain-containing protein n=1 Tax=Pseudidiomarina salilacus TaxID=3384452 RepID=UPI00398465BE
MRLETAKEIGEGIKKARLALGWSQTELAAKIGSTQAVVSRFEASGDGRIETLLKITEALELQLVLLQRNNSQLWSRLQNS